MPPIGKVPVWRTQKIERSPVRPGTVRFSRIPLLFQDLRDPSCRKGFTLLEVMVCLVIMSIAIPAFLGAIVQNVQLEAMNAETNIALASAQRVVEDIRGMGYDEITVTSLPLTFEATGLTNDGKTLKLTNSLNSTQVGVTFIQSLVNRKVVLVLVRWRSATGEDREIRLMTEVVNY